jgi:chorismate dehydratase
MEKLKVGRVTYGNLFPIFYTLEKEFDCCLYEFVEGVPVKLNRMLREGKLDISPSSSVEYLRNRSLYSIVDGISVSSIGPVGSVMLFSRRPIDEIPNGSTIIVSDQSETGVALLDVAMKRFYNIDYTPDDYHAPENAGKNYFFMIGDDCLKYYTRIRKLETYVTECDNADAEPVQNLEPAVHWYDLGEIWYNNTKLPFVFAPWIIRKEVEDPSNPKNMMLRKFVSDLKEAKDLALRNLPAIARECPLKPYLTEAEILDYWKNLDYDLTEDHLKGLELFGEYIK